jgi:hypothetical protein
MGWLWILVIPGLYALHRLGLWLEAKGWIRYRKAAGGGTLSGIMKDLEVHVRPQIRHVEKAKEVKPPDFDSGGEPP